MKRDGILGFWKGMTPNLMRGAILTATKMATYDSTKRFVMKGIN